jgi:glycosyltransferase involved in cell wall biosynthesis
MTTTARDRLAAGYDVDLSKVFVIAHGASEMLAPTATPTVRSGQFTALTWGLLGPGKGIEWAIDAMSLLRDVHPAPRHLIAGQTHPKVLQRDGDAYRDGLAEQVRRLSLESSVSVDEHYRDSNALAQLVRSADVVLLPYDSTQQVTSGVLIEAVAAGKPVIATEFPHARELLAGGAGLLVPHRDPSALATALRSLITRPDLTRTMAAAAAAVAPQLMWPTVAQQYRELASRLISSVAA